MKKKNQLYAHTDKEFREFSRIFLFDFIATMSVKYFN